MKLLERLECAPQQRIEASVCGLCGHRTTERKPLCSDHVHLLPHARQVIAELADREREEALVAAQGESAVDPFGSRAREILTALAVLGARATRRLRIDVDLEEEDVLEGYLRRLEREGLVELLVLGSRRGTPRRVATLTTAGLHCIGDFA